MKISVNSVFKERIESSGLKKKFICSELNMSPQWFAKLLRSDEIDVNTLIRIGLIINYDFSNDFPEINNYKFNCLEYCQAELKQLFQKHAELIKEHKDLLIKYSAIA